MKSSHIIGGIVVLIILIALAYIVAAPKSSTQTQSTSTQQYTTQQTTVPTTTNMTSNSTSTKTNSTGMKYAVSTAYNSSVGTYLVNATGWTLYLYTMDTPYSGNSTCYGSCATYWPVFYASNLTVNPSLNESNFSVITRTDGKKQLTYEGWPLYFYTGDKAPGQVNGQGVGGNWFVVTPALNYT